MDGSYIYKCLYKPTINKLTAPQITMERSMSNIAYRDRKETYWECERRQVRDWTSQKMELDLGRATSVEYEIYDGHIASP